MPMSLKKPPNKGAASLPTGVRNKMGFYKSGGKVAKAKSTIKKVVGGLSKASKMHAGQAKALSAIKLKKGGSPKKKAGSKPSNPSLYSKVKSEAKQKFKVYPSAYANAWLVKTYKARGGGYA